MEGVMETAVVQRASVDHSKQAILLWCVFFSLVILFNGTIPFIMDVDLHAWTSSVIKSVLFAFVFYAMLFLAIPLVILKGWNTVGQPAFLYPLLLAMIAITVWHFFHWANLIAVFVLAYLHQRFDLSDFGIRSRGWKGDILTILLMGILGLIPILMSSSIQSFSFGKGLVAGLTRLFANPASSIENLFYFGFLTEQLSHKAGKWLTPPLIGLMYAAHEMSNPEYWYAGMNFALIFVGVTIWAVFYLWRRSVVVIWLGDGLYRFLGNLF
jgi:hypothetical protein